MLLGHMLHPVTANWVQQPHPFSQVAHGCRSQLQGQMQSLESQLEQSQQRVSELQLQVASLQSERQLLEQALQGAHGEIQTLRGVAG